MALQTECHSRVSRVDVSLSHRAIAHFGKAIGSLLAGLIRLRILSPLQMAGNLIILTFTWAMRSRCEEKHLRDGCRCGEDRSPGSSHAAPADTTTIYRLSPRGQTTRRNDMFSFEQSVVLWAPPPPPGL